MSSMISYVFSLFPFAKTSNLHFLLSQISITNSAPLIINGSSFYWSIHLLYLIYLETVGMMQLFKIVFIGGLCLGIVEQFIS